MVSKKTLKKRANVNGFLGVVSYVPSHRPRGRKGLGVNNGVFQRRQYTMIHGVRAAIVKPDKYGGATSINVWDRASTRFAPPIPNEITDEINRCWGSLTERQTTTEFHNQQFGKHAANCNLSLFPGSNYYALVLHVGQGMVEGRDSLIEVLRAANMPPGHEYSCADLVREIKKAYGPSATADFKFDQRSGVTYLNEVIVLYHLDGSRWDVNRQQGKFPSAMFTLEDFVM